MQVSSLCGIPRVYFDIIQYKKLCKIVNGDCKLAVGCKIMSSEEVKISIWRSWDRASWYISTVKPTRCTIFRVYWISLYMFRTVFPSIIRSSRLYIQHQVYVIQVSWLLASGHEMELSSISSPLASNQLTCMTYTWRSMYSLELLMMDGKTVRNM